MWRLFVCVSVVLYVAALCLCVGGFICGGSLFVCRWFYMWRLFVCASVISYVMALCLCAGGFICDGSLFVRR